MADNAAGYETGGALNAFQRGYAFSSDARAARQNEQVRDLEIAKGGREEARVLDRQNSPVYAEAGVTGGAYQPKPLKDPFYVRLMDKFQSFGRGRTALPGTQPLAQPAAPPAPTAPTAIPPAPETQLNMGGTPQPSGATTYPVQKFADGGMNAAGYATNGFSNAANSGYKLVADARQARADKAATPATPAAPAEPSGFADGGQAKPGRGRLSPEEQKLLKEADARRARIPGGAAQNQTQTATPDPKKYQPAKEGRVGNKENFSRTKGAAEKAKGAARKAIPSGYGLAAKEGAGMLSKGGRLAGRIAVPVAVGMTALDAGQGAMSDEARMADADEWTREGSQGGTDALTDPNFYRDMRNRAGHAVKGVWDGLTGGGDTPAPKKKAPPQAIPATPGAAPAGPAEPERIEDIQIDTPQQQAIPSEPQGPPQEQGASSLDMSQFTPEDVPHMSTTDWVQFRKAALRDAYMGGESPTDALQRIDSQVTKMQQDGFLGMAQQGMAHQRAGDLKGAMAAYRAAYQYFPTGHDTQLGIVQGHIVSRGVDEVTGKPFGDPMVLTPESVSALIENFSDPGAWNQWAKDREDHEQELRKYSEIDKPAAESTARSQQTLAESSASNAQSNRINADAMARYRDSGGSSSGGSQVAVGLRDTQNTAEKRLDELRMDDPGLASALESRIAQWQQQFPDRSRAQIIDDVMRMEGLFGDQEGVTEDVPGDEAE